MGAWLDSPIGRVHLLGSNPRSIREGAFNALVESIERDPEFLKARGVVVWKVPEDLDVAEGAKSPFLGQKGKLVVIGGNMRVKAFKALGAKELKAEWIVEAKNADGTWWSPEKAERFVLVDNAQPGNSGENDYEAMLKAFEEETMRASGVDFSEFQALMDAGAADLPDVSSAPKGEMEGDPVHGERSDELEAFISEREKTRRNLKYIDEFGFHLLLVFPDGFAQKAEFLSRCGVFKGVVSADAGPYVDLVFESFEQRNEFARAAGLEEEDPETGVPPMLYGLFCDGRAFARKMGIELKETGLHFRDRKVDGQLAEMAMEEYPQKTFREQAEELRAERIAEGSAATEDGVAYDGDA